MPKNQFQRQHTVARQHNVPRHGAPLPMRKVEARKVVQPKGDATIPLRALEALLKAARD